jgi:hypothetical protein
MGAYNLLFYEAAAVKARAEGTTEAEARAEIARSAEEELSHGPWATAENPSPVGADRRRELLAARVRLYGELGRRMIAAHPFAWARAHLDGSLVGFLPNATEARASGDAEGRECRGHPPAGVPHGTSPTRADRRLLRIGAAAAGLGLSTPSRFWVIDLRAGERSSPWRSSSAVCLLPLRARLHPRFACRPCRTSTSGRRGTDRIWRRRGSRGRVLP